MGFFFYTIKITCPNCGKVSNVKIKNGMSVIEAVDKGKIKCSNCMCKVTPEEYETEWIK